MKTKLKKMTTKEIIISQLTFLDELMGKENPTLKLEQCKFLIQVSQDILYRYKHELKKDKNENTK